MHQDPSEMLARIPFGVTTGPIEGAEILVAGCRKETVASEMRSNVLKYRDTLIKPPTGFSERKGAGRELPNIWAFSWRSALLTQHTEVKEALRWSNQVTCSSIL